MYENIFLRHRCMILNTLYWYYIPQRNSENRIKYVLRRKVMIKKIVLAQLHVIEIAQFIYPHTNLHS